MIYLLSNITQKLKKLNLNATIKNNRIFIDDKKVQTADIDGMLKENLKRSADFDEEELKIPGLGTNKPPKGRPHKYKKDATVNKQLTDFFTPKQNVNNETNNHPQ